MGKGKRKKPSRSVLRGEACSGQAGWELLRLFKLDEAQGLRRHLQGLGPTWWGRMDYWVPKNGHGRGGWPGRENPGPDRIHAC